MRIGLLSDSHGFLDEALFAHFADCDELWHAGDFSCVADFDRLNAFRPTRAVWGNVDGADVRAAMRRDLFWECEGLPIYMTHIGGYPGAYDKRAREQVEKRRPGLFLCGHSHILKVMRDPDRGLIHMNPGACGHVGWHKVRTVLRLTVEAGKIRDLEAIELGPRGRGTGGRAARMT